MSNIKQLVASRSQCEKLVAQGISPVSFFWHVAEDDHTQPNDDEGNPVLMHSVCMLLNPVYQAGIYGTIPAWTKHELEVLMGSEYVKPDLYTANMVTKKTNPNSFPVYFPNKMQEFKNGAEASAEALIFLLQKKLVSVDGANARYAAIFNPTD